MGLFKQKTPAELVEEKAAHHDDLLGLAEALQKAIDSISNSSEEVRLTRKTTKLKESLVEQEIEHKKQAEEWEKEKRETEHKIGLQKLRGEQELELSKKAADQERVAAVKEAQLEVREGNISAKEEMFEERMEKVTEQLKDQIDYLHNSIVKELMKRLPVFNVDTTINHGGGPRESAGELESGSKRK